MSKLVEQLKSKEKMIGIWGLGYIGYSSMAHFAKRSIKCIGTDVDPVKVDGVNKSGTVIPNIGKWLGFNTELLVGSKMMQATSEWKKLISIDVPVHLICVPTEKHDEPFDEALIDVIEKLSNFKHVETDNPPLIIIESTITPDRVDKVVFPLFEKKDIKVGDDLLIGVAPRRDWFAEPERTLVTLPRVVGGSTPETTDLMAEVLGIVSETVLKATDHKHAAIVKSIENAYRCVEIQLANQLSLAYPDVNITEVLKWVGSKWNVGTYHPSVGIGGYCIPIAPKYVLGGAKHPDELTIFKTTIESFEKQPIKVADSIAKKGLKNVGILGLAYKGDIRVHILSPTIGIIKRLKEHNIPVKVHDPYYTDEEINEIVSVDTFSYPEGMNEFDTIIIVADHMLYTGTPPKTILKNLKNCKLMIDNMGIWSNISFDGSGIEYHEAGDIGWLG